MIFDKTWRLERAKRNKLKELKEKQDYEQWCDKEVVRYMESKDMLFYKDFAVFTPIDTPREIDIRIMSIMDKKGYNFIGYTITNNLYFKKKCQVEDRKVTE